MKIFILFGTRPEAIKMCPLISELKSRKDFQTCVCVTGQHKEMLQQVLECFDVVPDYDLSVMRKNQDLFDITTNILSSVKDILKKENPDMVLVHGDTTTTFAGALASFYLHIPVGHVEAGLRTYQMHSPFPEEFNRQAVALLASLHFAPTLTAQDNLLREGHNPNTVFVTGNTAIDALKTTVKKEYKNHHLDWAQNSRLLILTAHRRENLGEPLKNILHAIKKIVHDFHDVKVIYPIHLNPLIRQTASEILQGEQRIRLIEPLDALDFHNFLARSFLILTDSGGIQEEAPALGRPVLVLRDTTERPEGIKAGTLKLVGTNTSDIYGACRELLTSPQSYQAMSHAANPYGDGTACRQIADILKKITPADY